jgi:hypothetical protein
MLAGVEPDGLSAAGRLARAGGLLGEVAGPCGNGEILTWADPGDAQAVPGVVFGRIGTAGLLTGAYPGMAVHAPRHAADLMTRLREIDQAAAVEAFTSLATVSMAYHGRGRCREADARPLFGTLARLLGRSARWWANADGGGWNPVTGHTFDALVTGAGGGVIVTVLAYDED